MEDFDGIRAQLGRLDHSIASLEARRSQLSADVASLERQRHELDQIRAEREAVEREVSSLMRRKEGVATTLVSLEQRSSQLSESSRRLEAQIRELESKRDTLKEEIEPLESQHTELSTLQRQRGSLQRELISLSAEVAERQDEADRLAAEVGEARHRLGALTAERQRLENELEGVQHQFAERLALRDLGPKVLALVQRMDESAVRLGISRDEVRVKIYSLLSMLESDAALDPEVQANRRELERMQAEMAALRQERAESSHHPGPISQPGGTQSQIDETAREIKAFGEQATKAIEALVREVRQEADYLFQEAMEIGARAAQVDADLRTREWFNESVRYAPVRRPREELRYVAERALESFDEWLRSRQLAEPRTPPVTPLRPARQRRQVTAEQAETPQEQPKERPLKAAETASNEAEAEE